MPKPPFQRVARLWLLNKMAEVLIWAVLVVGFSLLPIFLIYNHQRTGGISPSLEELVAKGELLMVAAALAADSLSRLLSRTFARRNEAGAFGFPQLALLIASIAYVLLASNEYSDLVGRGVQVVVDQKPPIIDAAYVFSTSKMFFLLTLLTGAGVILSD